MNFRGSHGRTVLWGTHHVASRCQMTSTHPPPLLTRSLALRRAKVEIALQSASAEGKRPPLPSAKTRLRWKRRRRRRRGRGREGGREGRRGRQDGAIKARGDRASEEQREVVQLRDRAVSPCSSPRSSFSLSFSLFPALPRFLPRFFPPKRHAPPRSTWQWPIMKRTRALTGGRAALGVLCKYDPIVELIAWSSNLNTRGEINGLPPIRSSGYYLQYSAGVPFVEALTPGTGSMHPL